MRIIAGRHGGRVIEAPRGKVTHPMGERIRGALFNSLGSLEGLSVLDAFGGTGAVGIEAHSRGAAAVTIIEKDYRIYDLLKRNLVNLKIETEVTHSRANVSSWIKRHPEARFDIIICDPPYEHMQLEAIEFLSRRLSENGVFIVSAPATHDEIEIEGLQLVKTKEYADASIRTYTRES